MQRFRAPFGGRRAGVGIVNRVRVETRDPAVTIAPFAAEFFDPPPPVTGTAALALAAVLGAAGSLELAGASALALSATLAGAGDSTIEVTGASALSLSPSLSGSGSVAIAGSSALSAAPALASSGALAIGGSASIAGGAALAGAGALSIAGSSALVLSLALAGDGVAGFAGPRASRYSLSLALPVRGVSVSIVSRSLSVSAARRSVTVSLPARTLALSLPRRSLVASIQSFTKGDTSTPVFSLTIDTGTIATPVSLAAKLFPVGSTTVAATIAVATGDCTGWGTASVSVPVAFTSSNTPSAGRYNIEIVATYVDGTRRWPDNASAVQIDIKTEGAQ